MKLIDKVYSKVDNVIKYVFLRMDSQIVEFSYIDNGTGKDIICVSCQTMCNMGCKFCHCTDYVGKIKVFSLNAQDISFGVFQICKELETKKDTLLISYMGCGEPFNLLFEQSLIDSMRLIMSEFAGAYKCVRFGIATCLPKNRIPRFFRFCEDVKKYNLPVKLHLSLHSVEGVSRSEMMPNSLDIKSSLSALDFYRNYTHNSIEVHYTLIDNVNDSILDAVCLSSWQDKYEFNVKIINYNEKDTVKYKQSPNVIRFTSQLKEFEIYTPPGRDIGSSCGQFLLETHTEYIRNKE